MATHEFYCEKCGKRLEKFCSMKDDIVYPKCCGKTMSKKFYAPRVIIKGWSPDNERRIEKELDETERAMQDKDTTGITDTEVDVGNAALEKREDRLGLNRGDLVKPGEKKKQSEKQLENKALGQRKIIESSLSKHGER